MKLSSFTHQYLICVICMIIWQTHSFCSTGCTYTYRSANGDYLQRCTTTSSSTCTACDTQFYDPTPVPAAAGTCQLLAQNIYNTTNPPIPFSSWQYTFSPLSAVPTLTISSVTWVQLPSPSQFTQLIYMTQPYYGFRCRILFHASSRSNNPSMYFVVNNTNSYPIQNVPATDSQYNYLQWIYTSPFIQFSQPVIRLNIKRTDNDATVTGFHDVLCFIAYCTPNCLSCTSTSNCDSCSAGFLLDFKTKLCVSGCSLGQYSTGSVCMACHSRCQICTGSTATTCSKCTSSGPYQSFLQLSGTTCSATCTAGTPEYSNHTCVCGPINSTLFSAACLPCPTNCKYCSGGAPTCYECHVGYFMINGTTTCSLTCPAGQYINLIYDMKVCYLCDTIQCVQCINSSTMCTACNFATLDRYLFNYTCLYLCPDGYQGNNVTFKCDLCPLGMYSFQNTCYTQCPQYYYANDDIRACVVPGGYPINMTIKVQGANTLKFQIYFSLGLSNSSFTTLDSSWQNYLSLSFITQNSSSLILNKRRTLLPVLSKSMLISNTIITNNTITLFSSSVDVSMFVYSHSFICRFYDNLKSPKNVIYSIKTITSTDNNPWFVNQYFQLNLKPLFLIGIFLAIFPLLMILMRTKYVYRVLIQYIHSLQLLGLVFYAIYPHSLHIDLYSFLMGFDFANFSFLYNVPAKLITPCTQCSCLVSYNFAIGDMNWLRMMGPLAFCYVGLLIFCAIIYAFKCSRQYAQFYYKLIVDLVLIKTIHGWFASLLYSGLNFSYDNLDLDLFVLSMHLLSYILLIPVVYSRIKLQCTEKYPNISFIFLIIYIILITLLSLAPSIICALLILTSTIQWCLNIGLDIGQDQKPKIKDPNVSKQIQQFDQAIVMKFHNHLFRLFKPITAYLVAVAIMSDDQVVPIASISSVFGMLFLLIIVTAYFLYEHYQQLAKIQTKLPAKSGDMNDTKQDLRGEKQTQFRDKQLKIYDEDQIDDGVVGKRFRKSKAQDMNTSSNPNLYKSGQMFKNVQ